jgi:hypothetical protein
MKPEVTVEERLRIAVQAVLDTESGEGWILDHYVVVMGMQKIDSEGNVSSASWVTAPRDQADYVTAGLLDSATDMQADANEEIEGES